MKPTGRTLFDKEWRAKSSIKPISRESADEMIRRHYIGRWPGVVVLTLGLYVDERAVGVIVFALPPRETSKRYGGATWELARLWIDDSIPMNAESYLISRAIKYIKSARPDVSVLVSYADPSAGHSGSIYRAANWVSDGRTDQERKTPRCDYMDALTGKKYSRRSHAPDGVQLIRVPRVSKFRFYYALAEGLRIAS